MENFFLSTKKKPYFRESQFTNRMFATDQKILVNCSGNRFEQLREHAIRMACLLKRELCLFYYLRNFSADEYLEINRQLQQYKQAIGEEVPQLPVSILILKGKFAAFEESLTNYYQCILLITSREDSSEIRKTLHELRFPVMFLGEPEKHQTGYKKVLIPVDWTPKNKESAPWGNYLARFNQSEITLLVANEKNKYEKEQVNKNLNAIHRLFSKFQLTPKTEAAKANSWKLHHEVLERIHDRETELLIFMASRSVNLIDRLIGIQEDKIILNATVPVICLNPNRSYYLLCE